MTRISLSFLVFSFFLFSLFEKDFSFSSFLPFFPSSSLSFRELFFSFLPLSSQFYFPFLSCPFNLFISSVLFLFGSFLPFLCGEGERREGNQELTTEQWQRSYQIAHVRSARRTTAQNGKVGGPWFGSVWAKKNRGSSAVRYMTFFNSPWLFLTAGFKVCACECVYAHWRTYENIMVRNKRGQVQGEWVSERVCMCASMCVCMWEIGEGR